MATENAATSDALVNANLLLRTWSPKQLYFKIIQELLKDLPNPTNRNVNNMTAALLSMATTSTSEVSIGL